MRNVGFATRAMLGVRQQDRGCAVREVGRKRESVLRPRKAKSPKSSSMENEWAIVGQAVKLCRKSKQSVLTTDKKAHVGNPRGKASASTTAS